MWGNGELWILVNKVCLLLKWSVHLYKNYYEEQALLLEFSFPRHKVVVFSARYDARLLKVIGV